MLSKTTISALRALIYLARREEHGCVSPRRIAEALAESPTYLAKSLRHLVKTGILRAEKGVHGGVRLGRQPAQVTLLSIVEACQGAIVADFCESLPASSSYCGLHRAALDLHTAITEVLSRWTLAQFLDVPSDAPGVGRDTGCVIQPGQAP
jgi:Rrf2 family protein